MTISANILTTLEYLGRYEPEGNHFLGVTVQISAAPDTQLTTARSYEGLLCPWLWNPLSSQQTSFQPEVWRVDTSGAATSLDCTLVAPGSVSEEFAAFLQRLHSRFQNAAGYSWTSTKFVESVDNNGGMRWPVFLAYLGRAPYPLQHMLKLAYFLRVAEDLTDTSFSGTSLFAGSVFRTATEIFSLSPIAPLQAPALVSGIVKIDYRVQSVDGGASNVAATLNAQILSA